ncbi:hypothetical protein BH09VER1_BH09VER1_23780 [soil metagenome]
MPLAANHTIAAFREKFGEEIKSGSKWSGKKSHAVASATIASIKKGDGSSIELTTDQQTAIAAIFNPSVGNQMSVLRKVIDDAGGTLDQDAEGLLKSLLNPAGVQKQLENAKKPGRLRIANMIG